MYKKRKNVTIIYNVTNECNLSCIYCFEGQFCKSNIDAVKTINQKFSASIPKMLNVIKGTIEWNGTAENLRILLHGGEPLLISANRYRCFFEEVEALGIHPYYMLQTNGSLLTEAHVDLFKKYHVKIGVSIDGYAELHDLQRKTKDGKGTFTYAWKAIEKLRMNGLDPGGMSTITSNTIKNPGKFYSFFANNKLDLQFNPIFAASTESEESSIYITPKEYADFCCQIFDLWINDQENMTDVNNFTAIMSAFFDSNHHIPMCTFNQNCFDGFIVMDTDGELYHCHRTAGDTSLSFGNIETTSVETFMQNGEFMSQRWNILKSGSCGKCDNSSMCYGGCPYNAYLYKGSFFDTDYFCRAYSAVSRHIYQFLLQHEQ